MAAVMELSNEVESQNLVQELLSPELRVPLHQPTGSEPETPAGSIRAVGIESNPASDPRPRVPHRTGALKDIGSLKTNNSSLIADAAASPCLSVASTSDGLPCKGQADKPAVFEPDSTKDLRSITNTTLDSANPSDLQVSASTEVGPDSSTEITPSEIATNTLRSATSAVFSAASLTSSRSSLDTGAVIVSIKSHHVYALEKGFYVGKLKEIPPPLALQEEWATVVRPRLVNDLRQVLRALPRSLSATDSIVEPEFCMAGEIIDGSNTIELKPTIRIRCGSKKCQSSVREATADLSYLERFSRGPVRVHLHAPRPGAFQPALRSPMNGSVLSSRDYTCRRVTTFSDHKVAALVKGQSPAGQADLRGFREGSQFHLMSYPHSQSACGSKLRVRHIEGGNFHERICTVGGLIRIDDEIYALTTAHAFYAEIDALEEEEDAVHDKLDCDPGFVSPLNTAKVLVGKDHTNGENRKEESSLDDLVIPQILMERIKAELVCARYSDGLGEIEPGQSFCTDFALLRIKFNAGKMLFNKYEKLHTSGNESILYKFTVDSWEAQPNSGPVEIIYGQGHFNEGYLLEGDALFMKRNAVFRTRKIQTSSPLREYSKFSTLTIAS
jgi:hypothetical protein